MHVLPPNKYIFSKKAQTINHLTQESLTHNIKSDPHYRKFGSFAKIVHLRSPKNLEFDCEFVRFGFAWVFKIVSFIEFGMFLKTLNIHAYFTCNFHCCGQHQLSLRILFATHPQGSLWGLCALTISLQISFHILLHCMHRMEVCSEI